MTATEARSDVDTRRAASIFGRSIGAPRTQDAQGFRSVTAAGSAERDRSEGSRATYRYRALDAQSAVQEGQLVAESDAEALARVRRLGLRPISIRKVRRSPFDRDFSIPGFGPKVKGSDLSVLARQFATMINAGVPLLRTLDVLRRQTENQHLAGTLDQMRFDIESGESLSRAVARHPKVFDHLFVSMVRSGEASGALDVVLLQLAGTLERSVAMKQKIRSAMAYPVAVLLMVAAVIMAMLLLVVPTFAGIYDDLGGTLPLPTRILIAASDVFTSRLPVVAVVTAVSVIGCRRWARTPSGRYRTDALKLRMPLVGDLIHKSAVARFGRTMAVLTRSGVPVLETLRITSETVGNAVMAKALEDTGEAVRRGEPIADNLERSKVFPALVVQLVSVGEETGSLDQMFEIVGSTFEEEVQTSVAGFAALIEPLMMAFIGLVVGGMVVALYLPMFRIIDLVQ